MRTFCERDHNKRSIGAVREASQVLHKYKYGITINDIRSPDFNLMGYTQAPRSHCTPTDIRAFPDRRFVLTTIYQLLKPRRPNGSRIISMAQSGNSTPVSSLSCSAILEDLERNGLYLGLDQHGGLMNSAVGVLWMSLLPSH